MAECSEASRGANMKSRIAAARVTASIQPSDQPKKILGSASKLPGVGERLAVPFVPLVAQPAVHVQVNEFGPYWRFRHPL